MGAEIEVMEGGWVRVETERLVVSIHPGCEGRMGELRGAALIVRDLMGAVERGENTVESSRKPQ